MESHATAPYQSNPSGMSLTNRVGMGAFQRTHARTEGEQLQERLAQYQVNRQRRRERTVSPEPENRSNVPEDRLDPEITDAAFSLMVYSGNAETQETSNDMRELIRLVDADDQARAQRELMYRGGTVDELLPQSVSWSVGAVSASVNIGASASASSSTKVEERAWKEPATAEDKLERYPSDSLKQSSPEDGSKRKRKRSLKGREADMNNAAERASKKAKKSPSP